MKKIFILLFLLSCTSIISAQVDRFSSVNQVKGKEVYIIDNSALKVAYTIVDGKVKPLKKAKNFSSSLSGKEYAVENDAYTFKKENYLVLKGDGETLLLKEEDAPLYLSSFISKTYWQEKYDLYRNDYIYLKFKEYSQVHSDHASIEYDELTRIGWRGLEISDKGVWFYMSEYNGVTPLEKFKVASTFFEASKDLIFIKMDKIQPYVDKYNERLYKEKRDKEITDSITNSKIRLAIALDDYTFGDDDDENITVHKGDTLAIFTYRTEKDKYVARFHYNNILLEPEEIEFLDTKTISTKGQYSWETKTTKTSEDANYLKNKGEKDEEQRLEVASNYDNTKTEILIKKLKAKIADYNKEIAYRKKNQIFITGIGYDYDSNEFSNQFGLYFDIYNCFSKTIKYVEFTITCFNAVGDIQRDDVGRYSRVVRGIGPIKPEDGGRYSWNDIFWDDRDVIEEARLSNVKFIFSDGTSKIFSGYGNIKKHMTIDAWE